MAKVKFLVRFTCVKDLINHLPITLLIKKNCLVICIEYETFLIKYELSNNKPN